MSKPILYHLIYSPPVRSVYLVANEIGIELEKRFTFLHNFTLEINLMEGQHLTPEFLKINPQHTVPTLDDNGYILWESSAICTYLIDKYAKDDKLYPKELQIRSTINQRLFFNASIVFTAFRHALVPILHKKQPGFVEEQFDVLRNAYKLLNALFRDNTYLVGNSLTVADLCTVTTVSQAELILLIDDNEYPNIRPWLNRVAANVKDYDEINTKVIEDGRNVLQAQIDKNKAAATSK